MTMHARHTVFAWLLSVTFVAVAGAQAPSPKQQAADMAGQLMSPFCPGRLLSDCTSPDAGALRQDIAARVDPARRRVAGLGLSSCTGATSYQTLAL